MSGTDGWVAPGAGDVEAAGTQARSLPAPRPHAGPPVPPEPDGGMPRRRRAGLVVAGLLVTLTVALGIVAVITSGSDDESGNDPGSDEVAAGGATAELPDVTDGSGTTATTSDTAPASPPATTARVTAPDGAFAADLPAGWVTGFPGEGAQPLGEQMFPDDPITATGMAPVEAALVTPQTHMLALDPVGWNGSVPPPDLVVVDGMSGLDPGLMDLQEMADLAKPTDDAATVGAEGRLDGVSGEIAWFELSLAGYGFDGVRYVVTGSDSVWLVTFWSADLATTRGVGDAIVTSFDPG